MRAHARSIHNPKPYTSYSDYWGVKKHDSLQSAIRYFESNNPVKNVTVKNRKLDGWFGETWEVYGESLVSGGDVFLGVIDKD